MKARAVNPALAVKELGYFVGQWTTKGTILPGPWGAGGKFSWKEKTEWMDGRFFVIGRWNYKMPPELGGDGKEIFVMGYDSRQRVYHFDAFSSQGLHQVSRGAIKGKSWIWSSESVQNDKPVQQKLTMQILSRTRYKLKFELSYDGTTWLTFMEGNAIRR